MASDGAMKAREDSRTPGPGGSSNGPRGREASWSAAVLPPPRRAIAPLRRDGGCRFEACIRTTTREPRPERGHSSMPQCQPNHATRRLCGAAYGLRAGGGVLNGFRSGASWCGIAPITPRRIQFMAGIRWRIQTDIGSGFPPRAAFGSRAVRPSDSLQQPHEMASAIVAWSSRR